MTTVLLIDDHELIRQGLAGAFGQADGFDVVGQAGSVEEGLEKARTLGPDVVVTDVRLPDGSGLDVVRALRKDDKSVGLVVLTMYAGDEQLFAAMTPGPRASSARTLPPPPSSARPARRWSHPSPSPAAASPKRWCAGSARAPRGSPTASGRCSSSWPRGWG